MDIIGNSSAISEVKNLIQQVAKTHASVLIYGESGTGKELIARNIHELSLRAQEHFIAINSGAIPADLLESELFGHEKGAFTGAGAIKQGRFELAHKGTIFLDEIGDMPLLMQVKLLRVLQEHSFERVGGTKTIQTDVRIIAATNQDLEQQIYANKFREDLFYRLNVFPIKVPALRERKEDIPMLIEYFLTNFALKMQVCSFSSTAVLKLQDYPWPGNIRELINLLERLCIMYPGQQLGVELLPEHINNKFVNLNHTILVKPELLSHKFDLKQHMVDIELALINEALLKSRGVVSRAAGLLGIRRTTLVEKLKKYQIIKKDLHSSGDY